jgi:hypothetical protein
MELDLPSGLRPPPYDAHHPPPLLAVPAPATVAQETGRSGPEQGTATFGSAGAALPLCGGGAAGETAAGDGGVLEHAAAGDAGGVGAGPRPAPPAGARQSRWGVPGGACGDKGGAACVGGWTECLSRSTGRRFYYHPETRRSCWRLPPPPLPPSAPAGPGPASARPPSASGPAGAQPSGVGIPWSESAGLFAAAGDPADAPTPWQQATDALGAKP